MLRNVLFLYSPKCAFNGNVSKSVTIFALKHHDGVVWLVSCLHNAFHRKLGEVSAAIL